MAIISEFKGITVKMYHGEQGIPHFHALVEGEEALIGIENGMVLQGSLPYEAQNDLRNWLERSQTPLWTNWDLAIQGLALYRIPE